ncbi:unnamed protein product [Hyaloperonospora brassicae]|uniref:RxLR effector candidate protein n=1 Tax=Hyaloperonospora brassicae TaxID=162125 RepID=A0AAV0TLC6_HYABA|nr:unnamed protein product [Hyaloperonospora brassicae]
MRNFPDLLLVIAFTLRVLSSQFQMSMAATVNASAPTSDNHQSNKAKSSLRVADPAADEDRSLLTSAVSWLDKNMWLAVGKTDDEVKELLGLKGLTGTELVTASGFKIFEGFQHARKEIELKKWLSEHKTAHIVWMLLKPKKMPLDEFMRSDDYGRYLRYARMEDDAIYQRFWKSEEDVVVDPDELPVELNARVDMWAESKRPWIFVKRRLGIKDSIFINTILSHPKFEYYLAWLERINSPTAATLKKAQYIRQQKLKSQSEQRQQGHAATPKGAKRLYERIPM